MMRHNHASQRTRMKPRAAERKRYAAIANVVDILYKVYT